MIDNGIVITVVGMLVVFIFLILMVFSMRFMSGYILKAFPEPEESSSPSSSVDEVAIAVVIAAAYIQIRESERI